MSSSSTVCQFLTVSSSHPVRNPLITVAFLHPRKDMDLIQGGLPYVLLPMSQAGQPDTPNSPTIALQSSTMTGGSNQRNKWPNPLLVDLPCLDGPSPCHTGAHCHPLIQSNILPLSILSQNLYRRQQANYPH